MPKPAVTLEISRSTHPEFEFFASVTINGRQVARSGDAADMIRFTAELIVAGAQTGTPVIIADNR